MQSILKMIHINGSKPGRLFLLPAILILLSGCNREPDHPGWDYFPDMMYSPAYQSWSDNPVLEGEKTMQPPVEGSIPRLMIPYQYGNTDEDRERAGSELENPFTSSVPVIEQGRNVYSVYCMNCHGEKGDGLGHLFTSGKYLVPPASLTDERAESLSDGSIYHVISVGFGVMAPHASLVRPDDRWKAIHYIRSELQSGGQE